MQQGKGKYRICLMEKVTGTVIFSIPNTKDQGEMEGTLEQQIFNRLRTYTTMFNNDYTKAIAEVQGYLRALCNHLPKDKPWIVKVSERAGTRFLTSIGIVQTMHGKIVDGKMFLGIKSVNNNNNTNDVSN